jgi:hypothetical protein
MKAVFFFVCICFLLLKGETHVYATTNQSQTCFTLIQPTREILKTDSLSSNRDYAVINDIDADTDTEYFIDDDIEEEDVASFTASRCKVMVRIHPIRAFPSYPSILNYLCNNFKSPSSFSGVVSCKYILQSVFRI